MALRPGDAPGEAAVSRRFSSWDRSLLVERGMGQVEWIVPAADLARLGLAVFVGAVLGLEREIARKPAGLRTHILVALGATLLVLLGRGAVHSFLDTEAGASVRSDPIRVIQAIVVGISFLGAGTIVHDRDSRVEGLTTAASILLTAAIGIAIGLGRAGLAVCVAVGVAAILYVLGRLEAYAGWAGPSVTSRDES